MTLQEHIDEIMDYFDFEKVKRVMDFLDWRWSNCDGVPEVANMRRKVRQMITDTWKKANELNHDYWISSGGFNVTVECHKGGKNVIVRFELEDCESNPNPDSLITLDGLEEGGEK